MNHLRRFSTTLLLLFFTYVGLIISFSALFFTAIFGYSYGLDLIVAISCITFTALIFIFYFVYTHTKEYIRQNAIRTALLMDKEIQAPTPDTKAEKLLSLALSVQHLPPKLFYYGFLNKICGFFLWHPFHMLIELLLIRATEHLITQIKLLPTNLHYHAALANLYVTLSHHYVRPNSPSMRIFFPISTQRRFHEKAKTSSKRAVEELSILRSFAPNELWVHDQLAISYKELSLPEKEIEEYETIISMNPEDYNALLRLGILYFSQGENAKGLEVYEKINDVQPLLAETLISHYGAYNPLCP